MAKVVITADRVDIWMQTFEVDCSECGEEGIPPEEATTERIVFEDGTAARRPLCLACARKLGIDD